MGKDLENFLRQAMKGQSFNSIAVARIDFKTGSFVHSELENGKVTKNNFFDLASLTKPLTLSALKLIHPELFKGNKNFDLLLNHRASLPSGGRLSRET